MEAVVNKGFSFAEFQIDVNRRVLLKREKVVALNPKAFDLLLTLVENHGQVLDKEQLLNKVWADQFVEENNLTVHISALRKIFGEKKGDHQFIVTIPGRGYTFVSKVQRLELEEDVLASEFEKSLIKYDSNESNLTPRLSAQTELQTTSQEVFNTESTLIGRSREITEIKNLLRRDENRLITLTGAGGSGKTRLAQAVAEETAENFSDGVFFVELAAVSDAKLVEQAIAQAIGVKESEGVSLITALKNFLHERRILLVLDNFEHLISAALLIKELSESSQSLKILVTSRAALRLKIEQEFVVTPLALPARDSNLPASELKNYPAIALFAVRAQAVKPSFVLTDETAPVVTKICRRLDGLPLAIELAAARVKLLSPEAIFSRLEHSLKLLKGGAKDLPARQQTMRGTIEWSYNLLEEEEKILFRRLAVFAGGFSVETAEAICDRCALIESEIPDADSNIEILDIITSLVDKNLLVLREQTNGDARLRMLEVVREFALECLETSGEIDLFRKSHAQFFLNLAEEAEFHLRGEKSVKWLETLEFEIDNLRSALRWSLKNDVETVTRLAAALRYFWSNHNYLTEGLGWLEKSLERGEDIPVAVRFKLLNGIGQLARSLGNNATAQKVYEESLAAGKMANDLRQIVISTHGLAALATRQGDFESAQKFNEEELAFARKLGDESTIATALASLSDLTIARGKSATARPLIEESMTLSQKLGDRQLTCINFINLGVIDHSEEEYKAAFFNFAEALTMAQDLGNKTLISCSLDGLAAVAASCGESEQAARLAGAAENLRQSIGYEIEPTERRFREAYVEKIRGALDEKTFAAVYEHGQAMNLSEAIEVAKYSTSEYFPGTDVTTAEIVIESHTYSRIIIEEDIIDEEDELIVTEKNITPRKNHLQNKK